MTLPGYPRSNRFSSLIGNVNSVFFCSLMSKHGMPLLSQYISHTQRTHHPQKQQRKTSAP
jgi:hypothetical protein